MKIGILTRRYGYNMGSTLQAFAICELIKALGYDVEIIDYDETTKYPRWKIRPLIEHALYPVKAILGRNKSIYLRHRQLQEKKFNSFEKKYLPLSCKRLSSDKSLKNISRNYYKIVAGSDQIWSPFLFDSNFLGGFLSQEEKNKFVPYAPSIGTSKIGDIGEKERHLLKELPILSCREDVGADIVSKITGKHVPVVLDPTLMVAKETWLNIADRHCIKNLPSNYIVTYFLGNDAHMDVVREIARKEDSKMINVNMFNRSNNSDPDIDLMDMGPGEFLYLLKNANHVLTDSFHAIIFSWIFNRSFTIFERFKSTDAQNQNSRIHTLINILGCQSSLFGTTAHVGDSHQIETRRKKSLEFIIESLK